MASRPDVSAISHQPSVRSAVSTGFVAVSASSDHRDRRAGRSGPFHRSAARLCFPAQPGSRTKYSSDSFTPESVRADDNIPYQTAEIFYGGCRRDIRYKEVNNILWRRGSRLKPVRLIVVAPQPYKVSPLARNCYPDPAYLLTPAFTSAAALL